MTAQMMTMIQLAGGLADIETTAQVEGFGPAVQTVLGFTETLVTRVKHDLLNRDLVYDWLWIRGMWDRVGPAALRAREKAGVPQLYENFEALAQGQGG